ncbi:MAG: hypothetical protein ABSF91_03760 [Bacteroidota bacterium]
MKYFNTKALAMVCAMAILLLSTRVNAQHWLTFPPPIHAQLDQLSIGDIDFQHFTNNHLYFTLNMTSDTVLTVHLQAQIDINLADGTTYPGAARLTTKSFKLSHVRTMTNLDLGKNSDIKTQTFDYSQEAKDKIQKLALATGKLPAGTYTFSMTVIDDDNFTPPIPQQSQVITLTLSNISRLDLISPGDGSIVPTPFPMFQWIYDGDSVEVSVYTMLPQQHSKEEAASGVPQLAVHSGDPGLSVGSRSFQYPTSGARQLEAGKTYVWTVRGLTNGAGGPGAGINSEIWQFSVASSSGLTPNQQNFVNQLQLLLGGNTDVLNELASGNLQLTGIVTVDGQQISAADIQRILNDLAANPDKIVSIEIVSE